MWKPPTEKTCNRCGVERPMEEFPRNKTMSDGHLNQCRFCVNQAKSAWRKKQLKDPDRAEKIRRKAREKYFRTKRKNR